jgi:hypothetical protein
VNYARLIKGEKMRSSSNTNKFLEYKFKFVFRSGEEKSIELKIQKNSLLLVTDFNEEPPEWTQQDNFCCPIKSCLNEHSTHCPIAVNLNNIISFFSDIPSYEQVKIIAEINDRACSKKTSVQDGVGSIVGIIMVTSGCPVLGKLKPLVRFHLPFATIEETEFRVLSMYLLAQYFIMKNGKQADWEMNKLKNLYSDIQKINQNIAQKIADIEKMDTSINAVVILDNFANSVTFDLDDDDLSNIEYLFKEWMND